MIPKAFVPETERGERKDSHFKVDRLLFGGGRQTLLEKLSHHSLVGSYNSSLVRVMAARSLRLLWMKALLHDRS